MKQEIGSLVIVGTPIGNLGDMSARAIEILKTADLILCEDTRTSAVLTRHFSIKTPRCALHEHNETQMISKVFQDLVLGKTLALISDAGMPLISDPGYRLVSALRAKGVKISLVPGPTALTSALVLSGIPTDRFYFGGFLPNKKNMRMRAFQDLKALTATLVFYESPRRIEAALMDALCVLGPRKAAIAREISKLYEEVIDGTFEQIIAHFSACKPKGEMVLMIDGGKKEPLEDELLDKALTEAMRDDKLSVAVKKVAGRHQLSRGRVYERALELKAAVEKL